MKGKIKVLSLLCALAMVVAVFAGCSNTKTPATTEDNSIDTSKEVNLIWYHWGDEPKKSADVIAALNEQSKKDINTTIEFRWATGDDAKLKSVMASGGDYDIAFTCSWFANYLTSAQNGYLEDITSAVEKKTPTLWKSMPESVWDGTRVNGKIYAVPTYKDTAATQYWIANKEYLEKAGAMNEFKATGKAVSSVTPLLKKVKEYGDKNGYENGNKAAFNYNKAGLNGYNTGWDAIADSVWVGARIGSEDIKSFLDDENFIADLKTLKEWYDGGLVNKDCLTVEKEPEYLTVGTAQGWEGAEITAWGAGKPYSVVINKKDGPYLTTSYITGSCQGIKANSKNVDRALKYLEYANTDKTYRNMLAYGIEGKNYKLVNDGKNMEYINDDWKPGLFSQAAFTQLIPTSPAPADMYTNIDKANRAATASTYVGFSFNTESVSTEVAAVAAILEGKRQALLCGVVSDVDAYVKSLKAEMDAAGYQKIITEAQKQAKEFLANK